MVAVDRIKPELHVFGHIHSGNVSEIKHAHYKTICDGGLVSINASLLDEYYDMVYDPVEIEL